MWLGGANIVLRLVSLASAFIVLRNISVSDYGTVLLSLSLISPLASIPLFGINELIISEVARLIGERRFDVIKRLMLEYFKASFALTALFALLVIPFKPVIGAVLGVEQTLFFVLFIALLVLQVAQVFFQQIFRSHERFKDFAFLPVIESASKLAGASFFILTGGLNTTTLLASYVLSKMVVVAVSLPFAVKALGYLRGVQIASAGVLWRVVAGHGKWRIFETLLNQAVRPLGPLIIGIFFSKAALAFYATGKDLYEVLLGLVPVAAVIFPVVSRKISEPGTAVFIVQKAKKYLALIYLVFGLGAYFFAPPVIEWLLPKFIGALPFFKIYLLMFVFHLLAFGQEDLLYAVKDQKFIFTVANISKVLYLISMPLLLFFSGPVGIIYAEFLRMAAFTVICERHLRKKHNLPTISARSFFVFDNYDRKLISFLISKFRPSTDSNKIDAV